MCECVLQAAQLPQPCVDFGTAHASLKGEDRSSCWSGLIGDEQIHLFLVADGHGGEDAAHHCALTVLPSMRALTRDDPSGASWRAACVAAFERANTEVRARRGCTAGCTLSVCCVNVTRCEVTSANVGDSSIFLLPHALGGEGPNIHGPPLSARTSASPSMQPTGGAPPPPMASGGAAVVPKEGSNGGRYREKSQHNGLFFARLSGGSGAVPPRPMPPPEPLSEDHRLEVCAEEQRRVKMLGGEIAPAVGPSGGPEGPLRLWPGGLAVARVIGDADCGAFVSCAPAVRTTRLPPQGASLLLASDGVWDCISISTAGEIVRRGTQRRPNAVHAQLLADQIVAKCVRARSGTLFDDTTCVVVTLVPSGSDGSVHGKSLHAGGSYQPPERERGRGIIPRARSMMSNLFTGRFARSLSPPRVQPEAPSTAASIASTASSDSTAADANSGDSLASPPASGTRGPPGVQCHHSTRAGVQWRQKTANTSPVPIALDPAASYETTVVEEFDLDESST